MSWLYRWICFLDLGNGIFCTLNAVLALSRLSLDLPEDMYCYDDFLVLGNGISSTSYVMAVLL